MSRLRLLPLHLILAVSLPLAAQYTPAAPNFAPPAEAAPTASKTSVLRIPSLSSLTLTPFAGQATPKIKLFVLPKPAHTQLRIAQNDGLCYTMRSSKFTARDLQSAAPKPSTYSSCTSASGSRLKDAEAVPSK